MKVTEITIGRLFNLGDYEHIRYEIKVSVEPNESAQAAFTGVERLLAAIRPKSPLKEDFEWHNIRARHDHWTEQDWWKYEGKDGWEKAKVENDNKYAKFTAEHKAWVESQEKVRALLDDLGAAAEYKDAKLSWEDEP